MVVAGRRVLMCELCRFFTDEAGPSVVSQVFNAFMSSSILERRTDDVNVAQDRS